MKHIGALIVILLIPVLVVAQHGNEWIEHQQVYAKIPVAKDGIYRLTDSLFNVAGFPTNFDPRKLQLFHRGIQQRIIVSGENDGVFNTSDYVEFYGRRNDGTLDANLYEEASYQPHKLYNLFNDTTFYFLTVGSSTGLRMTHVSETDNSYPDYTFHLDEQLKVLSDFYSQGKDYGEIIKSTFDEGEGFMGQRILHNGSASYTLSNVKRMSTAIGKPTLELLLTGLGEMNHTVEVHAGTRLLTTRTLVGFESVIVNQEIEWSDIDGSGNLNITVMVKVAGGDAARASVNYIKVSYPQQLDMNLAAEYKFMLPANGASKSLLNISNASASTRLFDVTDQTSVFEIGSSFNGTLSAVIPSQNSERIIYASNKVIKPGMIRVTFREIDPEEHNYVIISHRLLRKPGGGYADPVKAYAAYRASEAGGEHDTLVVNINEVYDQFSYGEQTPLGIMNFMQYLASERLPDYLFLIGKGLDVNYNYFRSPSSYPNYKNLIPSAGIPASDAAFTQGLDGSAHRGSVATGRLSVMKPAQVSAYLNKVIEKEGAGFSDLRKKNLLHLSGGIYAGEPQTFRAYLESFAEIAEGYYLGGKVDAIAKQSTDIKLLNISDEVNAGLSLITFFGHSSPGTIDFDIGYVTDEILGYHNKGKYPGLLMNGCQAGAFLLNSSNANKAPVFGEDWINAADRGAVAFVAHSSFGFAHLLRRYSGYFYDVAFADSVFLTKGVGDVQREVAKRYLANEPSADAADITQIQQMMLLGDPAVSLFGAPYPDYNIEDENISLTSFDENPVSSYSDSFAINFIVRNYGQARNKPLHVQVKRTYGNRQTVIYDSTYLPLMYADTLVFIIRGENKTYFGNNTFEIRLDAKNDVTEMNEANNVGYLDYFLPLNGTSNLFPRRFGIVSSKEVDLAFQHSDILSGERTFEVEVDTLNTFDSPFKKSFTTTGTVLSRQPLTLLATDSLVYYWRTKLAEPGEFESKDWTLSSFTFIDDGPDGWAQSHFPQLLENTTFGLNRDPGLRLLQFDETVTSVFIRNYGSGAGKPLDSISFKINDEEYHLRSQGYGCRTNTINLVAFDKISTAPYLGVIFNWTNRAGRTCGREPWVINSFRAAELVTGNNDDLIQYIDNVSPGDSIILFTIGNALFSTWPQAAKDKLGEIGIASAQLQSLTDGEPIVIFARKGADEGSATFIRSNESLPLSARLKTNATVTGRSGFGKMVSALVGPATQWHDIDIRMAELEEEDTISIDVIGIKTDGTSETILEDISTTTSITEIDASIYPQLRLVLNVTDTINVSSPQLRHWIVTYEPVAEGLVIYRGVRDQETLSEGEVWNGEYGFINVSDREFPETLTVSYKVLNHHSLVASAQTMMIDGPLPGDTTLFTIPVNTFNKAGLNDVEVDVNPKIYPEHSFENNLLALPKHLNVITERFSPVLDVTVDGRYIENDEFVSPRPPISVMVWDENQYLLKKDTIGINVYIGYPCGDDEECVFRRVNFSDEKVTWTPASDTNDFRISYQPDSLADGRYIILIEAADESGNDSGEMPFELAFQVSSEEFLEVTAPYPNPASAELNIMLNVTGPVLPEKLVMTLTNVSGKVAGKVEKSSFHYGRNKITILLSELTTLRLLPGIYIYEMTLHSEGRPVKSRGKLLITE